MISILVSALLAILSALAAYGTSLFKIYMQSKMSASQWDFLKSQATTAVKWLEQSPAFSGAEGAKKKEAAVMYVLNAAEKAGIPMTHELADKLVEEAVFDMKDIAYDMFDIPVADPILT